MSVESNKIVVAWDGWDSRSSYDIYYATSKDGGKTWTRPLKVTDRAKDDITSERPQVALQNGVIHLFYAQGKWNRHEQASNQGSWPVYYQQRPFPD
jgi:Neuraminidase (sialidase)